MLNRPPPTIDGISASSVQLPSGPWPALLDFLAHHFPDIGAETWRTRMARGRVLDEDGAALAADSPYRSGHRVYYYRELPPETVIPFEAQLLHRDTELLVADKPHFLPTMPAGRYLQESLLVRLKRETGIDDLAPLHRLDRGTAGLVLFSVNPETRAAYSALFAGQQIDKVYEALAPTLPDAVFPLLRRSRIVAGEPFFRMQEVPGEPNAETVITLIASRGDCSLYRLQPRSGKKHQLRVHMAALGMAIVNDRHYPVLQPDAEDDTTRPLKLLARRLSFRDPLSGELRVFESRRSL